jgi:transposase, IS30 family
MGTKYTQLTDADRYKIDALLRAGTPQKDIATQLGVNPSTVSRERKRRLKRDGTYDGKAAVVKAHVKRGNAKWTGMKIEKYRELRRRIIEELSHGQSPETIAGRMKTENTLPRVSSDTIYQWLYSPRGIPYSIHLCTKRRKRRKVRERTVPVVIPQRISIHNRPEEGVHAEADTFHSPKTVRSSVCVALTIRPDTKEFVLRKATNQSPTTVARCFKESITHLKPDTLTFDNGLENRAHLSLGIPTYFCDLASPRQKPYVEGAIGLVRRWFLPKGTDLSKLTQKQLDEIVKFFDHKYRKSLAYRSPREERARLDGY